MEEGSFKGDTKMSARSSVCLCVYIDKKNDVWYSTNVTQWFC